MLTTPITTRHFHSRVLALLSSHISTLQPPNPDASGTAATTANTRPLTIPPLTVEDSHLAPNGAISNMVAVASSWIDLCSPDPLIADVSRQVLALEIAYAAFCGVSFVVIPGPRLHHGNLYSEGVMYYARAIQDVMDAGPYMQIHIWMRMVDNPEKEATEMGDLAPFARPEFLGQPLQAESAKVDLFGTWDAWNAIRTMCKYHSRLFVGKNNTVLTVSSTILQHLIYKIQASSWPSYILFRFAGESWLTSIDSTVAAEISSSHRSPDKMALRTRSHPIPRCEFVHKEPKGISCSFKSTPISNFQIHASTQCPVDIPM